MINIDGSYHENKGEGSTGAVIRDSAGTFVAAAHSFIPHALDAATSEAAALRDGLLLVLAQLIGCTRVEIQSDSVEVVQTMIESGFSATAAVSIFDEIAVLWKEFREISISHYNREVNIVARELARQAFVQHNSQVWIDDPPSFIFHHLVNNVSILVNQ